MSVALISSPSGLTNSKLALADADTSEVLSGKTFYSQNKELKTGNMPNNGAISLSVDAGEDVTIPIGYHNGNGKVSGNNNLSVVTSSSTGAVEFRVSGQWRYQMYVSSINKTTDKITITVTMAQMLETQDITEARKYVTITLTR